MSLSEMEVDVIHYFSGKLSMLRWGGTAPLGYRLSKQSINEEIKPFISQTDDLGRHYSHPTPTVLPRSLWAEQNSGRRAAHP